MFLVILLSLILVLLALLVLTAYSGFQQLRDRVAEARRQLDADLNRRSELVARSDSGGDAAAVQQELAVTEDRIAHRERYYNATARHYNNRVETLPASFVASLCKFEKAAYFEVGSDQSIHSAQMLSSGGQQ